MVAMSVTAGVMFIVGPGAVTPAIATVIVQINVRMRIDTLRCAQDRIGHRNDHKRRKKQRHYRQSMSK
jgi:hypothetical protein